MNPILSRIGGAWLGVTAVVAGVDAYRGMNCANRVGGYLQSSVDTYEKQRVSNAIQGVFLGAVRGVIYNFGQSLSMEGTCGANSYTMAFGDGLGNLFNNQASRAVRSLYLLNQGVLGIGGAVVGGIVAEELHVFGQPAPKVSP